MLREQLIVFIVVFVVVNCELEQLQDVACWKRSYGRGVGSFKCGKDDEKNGLLCYQKCDDGYTGVGPVCWESVRTISLIILPYLFEF